MWKISLKIEREKERERERKKETKQNKTKGSKGTMRQPLCSARETQTHL